MRIAVLGCAGRMGRANVATVLAHPELELAAAVEAPGGSAVGADAGTLAGVEPAGVPVTDDAAHALAEAAAAIAFTTPAATVAHARLAAAAGSALVIGTTGLDADAEAVLDEAAADVPVVYAANMSLGVNLLSALVETVAKALDERFDVEIVELHHNRKVDAPSGTALALGRAAARGRGVRLDDAAERGRDGLTGTRALGKIGFAALRGGDVVGDHTVLFCGSGERLELTHRASDRGIYSRGAAQAALWTRGRSPGLYDMVDVLGLRD